MKIRSSFVTNSSSSSFIVQTNHTHKEVEELLKKALDFYNDWNGTNLQPYQVYEVLYGENNKPVIWSAEDNSIPYWMSELIEDKFETWRKHHG